MNRLFWSLPHDVRRVVFRIRHPEEYDYFAKLRTATPAQLNVPTFRPLIEKRCIFVHIPKSAGISVGHSIFGRHTGNHTTIQEYQIAFSRSEFETFYKFAFVRNPFDRLYSAFHFMKNGGRNAGDARWAELHLSRIATFEDFVLGWVNKENVMKGIHFVPQHLFLTTPASPNAPLVDFVGRFENLEKDFQVVKRRLGLQTELRHENRTYAKNSDYKPQYNRAMIDVVSRVYGHDLSIFNYRF